MLAFFSSTCAPTASIIVKIVHMVLLWMNAAPEAKRAKMEEAMKKIKRSLEFLTTRDAEPVPLESPSSPNAA